MPEKALMSWSGGKDSALALYEVLSHEDLEVTALLTTVTEPYDRVSMHGIRRELLEEQAGLMGFPIEEVMVSSHECTESYEIKMRRVLEKHKKMGVSKVIFGDTFLEEIRSFREKQLHRISMKAHFPIWNRNTRRLTEALIRMRFRAVITCIDSRALDRRFVGRSLDRRFLADLPDSADPGGENGEYHTFIYDGPLLKRPVRWKFGKVVLRDSRFYYCDLIPKTEDK